MKHNKLTSAILVVSLMLLSPILWRGAGGEASAQNTFRYEMCENIGPTSGPDSHWNFFLGSYWRAPKIHTLQVPSDSGYIIFTDAADNKLVNKLFTPARSLSFSAIKLDKYSNVEWVRAYPNPGLPGDEGNVKQQHVGILTTDGGFVMAGERYNSTLLFGDNSWGNTYIQKMDKNGHLLWAKRYPIKTPDYATQIQQMPNDDGFIVMGYTEDVSHSTSNGYRSWETYLLRLDKNGDKVWCYYYDAQNKGEEQPQSLDLTADGGFIIGGISTNHELNGFDKDTLFHTETLVQDFSQGSKAFMMKVSGDGKTVEWAKRYGEVHTDSDLPISDDTFYETKQTPDGGYISVGLTEPQGGKTLGWVVKTDELGVIEWQKSYTTWSGINKVEVLNDGYILGSTNGRETSIGNMYGSLTKINKTGEVQWSKLYDTGITDINLTMDSGLVVTEGGQAMANSAVFNRVSIMKTNRLGELDNGCFYTGALSYQIDVRISTPYPLKPVSVNFTSQNLLLNEDSITEIKACPLVCAIPKKPVVQFSRSWVACSGSEINIPIYDVYGSSSINFSHYTIDFGDPASGFQNTISGSSPWEYEQVIHTYSDTGTYTLTMVVFNGDYTLSDTAYTHILVVPKPTITLLTPQLFVCATDTVTLVAKIEHYSANFYNVWNGYTFANPNTNQSDDTVYVTTTRALVAPGTADYYVINIVDSQDPVGGSVTGGCGVRDTCWIIRGDTKAIITGDTKICKGAKASLKANGGDSYLWSTGAKTETIKVSPTSTTTYWVEATTTDGCRDTAYIRVEVLSDISVEVLAEKNAVCVGDTVMLYAKGAENYTWSNGTIGDSIQVITAAGNNTYIVTGTSGSCTKTAAVTVKADPVPIVSVSGLPDPVKFCNQQTYTITASGGEKYYWNNSQVNNPQLIWFQNSSQGNFGLRVYNGGCLAEQNIEYFQHQMPSIIGIEADECRVCPGTEVTLRKSLEYHYGDQTPEDNPENLKLIYQWSTGEIGSDTNDSLQVTVTSDTIITLTITDRFNCKYTYSAAVYANPHFSITTKATSVASCDRSPTTIYLAGDPLLDSQYDWGNGIKQDTLVVSPLQDSMLYVTVTADGCTRNDSVFVSAKSNLPTATITGNAIICKGVASTYTASGNAPSTGYLWLSDNSTNPTNTIAPTTNTILKAVVTFAPGCTDTAEYKIKVMELPKALITGDTLVCPGAEVALKASGGYSYQWSTAGSSNTIRVTALADMPVTLYAYALNCSDTATVTIKTDKTITATLFADADTICAGTALTLIGGGGDDYAWNTGERGEQIGISPDISTNYTVSVTTTDNCLDAASITITVKPAPTLSISGETSVCLGRNITLAATGNGVGYVWTTGASTASITVSPANDSTYSVSTFIEQCGITQSHTIIVISTGIRAGQNQTIVSGTEITLIPSGGLNYNWSTIDGVICSNCNTITESPTKTTTYYLTETGTSTSCSEDSVTIYVLSCTEIFVPTAFSPNGDGINDVLYVKNDCIKELDFKIFDRWGNEVFQTDSVNEGWDGTYKGEPMDPAVFVYYVNAIVLSGEQISGKGNISLVR